jgi:hypothetical protein
LDTFGKYSYPIETFLPSSSLEDLSSLILYPFFATGVIDTGDKFAAGVVVTGGKLPPLSLIPAANLPPVSLTPVANLPPVSTTLAKLVAKFAAGVADTGGKFVTGVVDTGRAPLLTNISANFRKNSKRSEWGTLGLGGN